MTTDTDEFLATAIEQGTTENGAKWLIQSVHAGTTTFDDTDVPPYIGAVYIPEGSSLRQKDSRIDTDKISEHFTDTEMAQMFRGKNGAEGWLGVDYSSPRLDADADPIEVIMALLDGHNTDPEKFGWTREEAVEDIKRIATLIGDIK